MAGSSMVRGVRAGVFVLVAAALAACSGGSSPGPGPTTPVPTASSASATVTPVPTTSTSSKPVALTGLAGCLVGSWRQTSGVGTALVFGVAEPGRQIEGGPNSYTLTFRADGTFSSLDPRHEPLERVQTPQGVVFESAAGRAHGQWAVTGKRLRLFATSARLRYVDRLNGQVLDHGISRNVDMMAKATCTRHTLTYRILGDPNGKWLWRGVRQ